MFIQLSEFYFGKILLRGFYVLELCNVVFHTHYTEYPKSNNNNNLLVLL